MRRERPSQSPGEIAEGCDTLDETIRSVCELIFDVSSPTLYRFGLEAAVEELLDEKMRVEHGIHCTFRDDGLPKPLAEDVRIVLFQSVRELLVNAIKYAIREGLTEVHGADASPTPDCDNVPHPTDTALRLVVADDHDALRRDVCRLLTRAPGLEIVGQAANGNPDRP